MTRLAVLFFIALALVRLGDAQVTSIPGAVATAVAVAAPSTPTVTNTFMSNQAQSLTLASVNWLQDTDNLGSWVNSLETITEGQPAEDGTNNAVLVVPTTASNYHNIEWGVPFEPANADLSVYVKASGYSYVLISWNDSAGHNAYGNSTTCAVVSQPVSGTLSATLVGSGPWCRFDVSYSPTGIGSATTYVDFWCGPTSSFTSFAGDGVSGCYLSHPQLSPVATVQTYTPTRSGIQHYAVCGYLTSGVTTGCSPFVSILNGTRTPNASSYNTITPATCPTGTDHIKIFRTGWPNFGSIGNVSCASIAAFNDIGQTADGTTAPVTVSSQDNRLSFLSTHEYQAMNYPGATQRVFEDAPGTAGTVTLLHFTQEGLQLTGTLTFACGGTASTVTTGTFGGLNAAAGFSSDTLLMSLPFGSASTWSRKTEINYINGCSVVMANGYTGGNLNFEEVTARSGANPATYATRAVWHAVSGTAAITQFTIENLLSTITNSAGGELESVSLYVPIASVEGDLSVYTDGFESISSNGTEDFFGSGFNCASGSGFASNRWGCVPGTNTFFYRFFNQPGDRLPFNNSLQVVWPNGQLYQSTAPGTLTPFWTVTYWTGS